MLVPEKCGLYFWQRLNSVKLTFYLFLRRWLKHVREIFKSLYPLSYDKNSTYDGVENFVCGAAFDLLKKSQITKRQGPIS